MQLFFIYMTLVLQLLPFREVFPPELIFELRVFIFWPELAFIVLPVLIDVFVFTGVGDIVVL